MSPRFIGSSSANMLATLSFRRKGRGLVDRNGKLSVIVIVLLRHTYMQTFIHIVHMGKHYGR